MILNNYKNGFLLTELLPVNKPGFHINEENIAVGMDKQELEIRKGSLLESGIDDEAVSEMFSSVKNTDVNSKNIRDRLKETYNLHKDIIKIGYNPFDNRFCLYNNAMVNHFETVEKKYHQGNFSYFLNTVLQTASLNWSHIFISRYPSPVFFLEENNNTYVFPLYNYQSGENGNSRTGIGAFNAIEKIIRQISVKTGLTFIPDKEPEGNVCMAANKEVRSEFKITFSLEDIVDYIYAVLYSPAYRRNNNENLKNDFPRIPYPDDTSVFWKLVELGGELKKTHLLESPKIFELAGSYSMKGNNETTAELPVGRIKWEVSDNDKSAGRVWINGTRYFDKVPIDAWNLYVGGYQPAQKWLTDRSGRALAPGEIIHYQSIIASLTVTHNLMQEIDKIVL